MHQMDAEGKSFNKAEINRQLRGDRLSARNRSSIEFRMCNISSVFTEMGVDYLKGYRPAENVGANVREAIADAVEKPVILKEKDSPQLQTMRCLSNKPERSEVVLSLNLQRELTNRNLLRLPLRPTREIQA